MTTPRRFDIRAREPAIPDSRNIESMLAAYRPRDKACATSIF
jgi:hypothetical protein